MMDLEFYQELLLTAVFSILIAFLIGKITVVRSSDGELTENASVSADRAVSVSSGEKLEGSGSEEGDATADRSGTEGELVGEAEEKSAVGTGMIRVEDEFAGNLKMSEVVESLWGEEVKIERGSEVEVEDEGSLLHGEDDWEGIEKSEVEKLFAVATEYVRSSSGAVALSRLNSDVQMELYGLNKIATEGPCYESQPLPLNFSARAKWQTWQKLGNMSPEVAMEQYINLLFKNIPRWMDASSRNHAIYDKGNDSPVAAVSGLGNPDLRSPSQHRLSLEAQRKSKDLVPFEIDHATEGSTMLEKGFTSTFILNLLSPTRGAFLSIYW